MLRTSQSHLETEESLCPFHWQPSCKIASSVCMEEVSLQEATAEISLQSIQAIKKEREKNISKGSFRTRWKDGKNILPSKERHDNFQLQAFSVCHTLAVYLQTKLKPEYLPQTYGGGIQGRRLVSWVWLCLTKLVMGICGCGDRVTHRRRSHKRCDSQERTRTLRLMCVI